MPDPAMLEGKTVIVTGAGGGIGRDIALAMAGHGACVVVNDIGASLSGDGTSVAPGQAVVDEITAAGGRAVANADSVADPSAAERIVQCALDHFGRVDALVNNAGILRDRMFHKMSVDEWRSVLQVHLDGAFYTSRAVVPHLRAQGCGSLIHMTSTSGLVGNFGQANYSAAKLGVTALSKSIALDLLRFNVRSNCIAPFAWSRMTSSIPTDTPEQMARVAKLQQMTPAKIAPLAVYLASDAAAQVNAQVFAVRNNEIFVMSQPRPVRSVHRSEGWSAQSIAEHAMPALHASLVPLERSADVFSWDPV
jgi:NAD(P)-dependent dehydrogenase (short-subunit alcohol dehydrogenase family)